MNILHGDFRLFGDNRVRSDSGLGGGAKAKALLRAGAGLLTSRVFGIDFDDCRTLGRYLIARASARASFSANTFSIPFVFTPDAPELSVSNLRLLKTNLVPSLCPQEGRDRFLPAGNALTGFPPSSTTGDCR